MEWGPGTFQFTQEVPSLLYMEESVSFLRQEKGMTEDEVVGWHHRLKGHEFE